MFQLLPLAFRFLGFKGTAIVLLGLGAYALFSGNLGGLLTGLGLHQTAPPGGSSAPFHETAEEKEQVEFVSVILADIEETWATLFQEKGLTYKEPRLVLFRDAVSSACGMAQSAMGPFYCPADQQVYIDLSFYDQLRHRFKAPGDFAQAYVIAHEVGQAIPQFSEIDRRKGPWYGIHLLPGVFDSIHPYSRNIRPERGHHEGSSRPAKCFYGQYQERAARGLPSHQRTLRKPKQGFAGCRKST